MITPEQEHELVKRICKGDTEAEDWMQGIRSYCHLSDDIIDEDIAPIHKKRGAERMCQLGALSIQLYCHPFFRKHQDALYGAMLSNIVAYADSVQWEGEDGWKGVCSDWLRHGGIEIVLIIAAAVGGYAHMRSFSQELRTMAYELHHDQEGKQV
jgi:hypothetical protein